MNWAQVFTLGGAVIGAIWALFRWGLSAKLDAMQASLDRALEMLAAQAKEIHALDVRLTRLEARCEERA